MSQGMTSQISPKSSSSPPLKKWAIAETQVVPHFGYVTTKTSLALTSKARPWRMASVECMRALRAASIAIAFVSALRARRRRQARAASAAAAAAVAAAVVEALRGFIMPCRAEIGAVLSVSGYLFFCRGERLTGQLRAVPCDDR
jgi:hypothetical protein